MSSRPSSASCAVLALVALLPGDALAGAVAPPPAAAGLHPAPAPLSTRIAEVTVYGDGARVQRRGTLPGSGAYTVAGLPGGLAADSVRVRLSTGNVVSVETVARVQAIVPDARVQELRGAVAALRDEHRALNDQRDVQLALKTHLLAMLDTEGAAHERDLAEGRSAVAAWQASLTFAGEQLTSTLAVLRDLESRIAALATRLADAQAALGAADGSKGVALTDVVLDVLADAPAELQLEYLIGQAGWQPLYDLRTSADGTIVNLSYRARVWQRTGEDWTDTAVLLSTAQPQRGAQGPEPRPIKLSVRSVYPAGAAEAAAPAFDAAAAGQLAALGYLESESGSATRAKPSPFAQVIAQGLSVQFRLPRAETVLSREEPTTVLVGEQDLKVVTEHYVTPLLDTTVWLRGRTTNTTPWTLLPGPAAVYFGGDFIGNAGFDKPVLPAQEFTLHLGADPGLVCKREQTQDLHEEPGFLGRRQSLTEGWRIELENLDAHGAAPDGSVVVIVREAFPKSADERIEVAVSDEMPAPSRDERWKKELEEQGLHTWLVTVPRSGKTAITWTVKLSWPEDVDIVRDGGFRR